MPINTILGLSGREQIWPQYLDIKALNDNIQCRRLQLRQNIGEIRSIRAALGAERDLYRRYSLKQDQKRAAAQICALWGLYRDTQNDSRVLIEAFRSHIQV